MLPVLTKESDFNVWQLQFESATKSKIFSKLTGVEKDDEVHLENFRLSSLPSALHEQVLVGCSHKFTRGTTTYKTALQAVRDQWVRITRPVDITAEMNSVKITCTEDVVDAWQRLLRLRYYSTISDDFMTQLLINAISDPVTKQSAQSYMFGKSLGPQNIVDFLSSLTFAAPPQPTYSAPQPETVAATSIRCYNCNKFGHIARRCPQKKESKN